jgi:hypothetical protein
LLLLWLLLQALAHQLLLLLPLRYCALLVADSCCSTLLALLLPLLALALLLLLLSALACALTCLCGTAAAAAVTCLTGGSAAAAECAIGAG